MKGFSRSSQGILLMLCAIFIFSCVNLIVKNVTQRYPVIEVVFFRCLFMLIPVSISILRKGKPISWRSGQIGRQVGCGILGFVALFCLFSSFHLLPLSTATLITFSSIFIVTIMAFFLLKEQVPFMRWIAIGVGFMGVSLVATPGGGSASFLGVIMGVSFAILDAFIMVNNRILSSTDAPELTGFYFAIVTSLISGFLVPFFWVTPDFDDLWRLVLLGIIAGTGQLFLINAFQKAPASLVAPMIYSGILWGIAFGFFIYGEVPTWTLFVGAFLITASGLINVFFSSHQSSRKESLSAVDGREPLP